MYQYDEETSRKGIDKNENYESESYERENNKRENYDRTNSEKKNYSNLSWKERRNQTANQTQNNNTEQLKKREMRKTKKQKDRAALRSTLIRIIVSGVLFLLVYLIAEFEPEFIPVTVRDIKEALSYDLLDSIKIDLPNIFDKK